MEPRELGKLIAERVVHYCEHRPLHLIECLVKHAPKDLDKFANEYLFGGEEEKSLEQMNESLYTSWREAKEEYKKLWSEKLSAELSDLIDDEIQELYTRIKPPPGIMHLTAEEKAELIENLEEYAKVLQEFADVIKRALQEEKPLPGYELYNWLYKVGAYTVGLDHETYYDTIDHYTDIYDMLDDSGKLKVLNNLLDSIDKSLYNIEQDLKELSELEALTNER